MFSCKIVLIPEYGDLFCKTFPLRALHSNLFNSNVDSFQNPCCVPLNNKNFVMYSSKAFSDLLKYIKQNIGNIQTEGDGYRIHLDENKLDKHKIQHDIKDTTHIVNGIIKSRLLCPNAPDTLPTIPYGNTEAFIINMHVDYFVIPNCENATIEKDNLVDCNILSIPNFNISKRLVILNTSDNSFEILKFSEDSLY